MLGTPRSLPRAWSAFDIGFGRSKKLTNKDCLGAGLIHLCALIAQPTISLVMPAVEVVLRVKPRLKPYFVWDTNTSSGQG